MQWSSAGLRPNRRRVARFGSPDRRWRTGRGQRHCPGRYSLRSLRGFKKPLYLYITTRGRKSPRWFQLRYGISQQCFSRNYVRSKLPRMPRLRAVVCLLSSSIRRAHQGLLRAFENALAAVDSSGPREIDSGEDSCWRRELLGCRDTWS